MLLTPVATPIAGSDLLRAGQPSLFVAMSLSRQHSDRFEELVVAPRGYIDEVGFAARWTDPLSAFPPRNPAFCRDFYRDRFFGVQAGECGGDLVDLEINEALVEDTYMRGSIDYTGFEMILTFGAEAYTMFAELAEIDRPRAMTDHRGLVLGIPTPPFAFPAQRGSPKPGDARIEYVKKLEPIKRLKVSDMTIAAVSRRMGAPSDSASILDRFEILSVTKLTLAQL